MIRKNDSIILENRINYFVIFFLFIFGIVMAILLEKTGIPCRGSSNTPPRGILRIASLMPSCIFLLAIAGASIRNRIVAAQGKITLFTGAFFFFTSKTELSVEKAGTLIVRKITKNIHALVVSEDGREIDTLVHGSQDEIRNAADALSEISRFKVLMDEKE
jgi:hypothetical protein